MSRRLVFALAFILALAFPEAATAQRVYRIGSLNTAEQFVDAFEGFKSRMAELGYVEGRNVHYDFYNSKGSEVLLNGFAKKLVENRVDLIVTSSTTATVAAAKATEGTNIPVLFLSAGNPQKLVKSFASSGSNLAGISSATLELTEKRLELLKELVPSVRHIASLNGSTGVNYQAHLAAMRQGAKKLGLTLWEIEVQSHEDIVRIAPTITRKSADAIFSPPDSMVTDAIEVLVKQSIKEKLPLIPALGGNVKKGCLATYSADYFALGRQGAMLADKIFKGIKASDLPIELPHKLKLVINLKTGKAIGLKIPREILIRADEVIE